MKKTVLFSMILLFSVMSIASFTSCIRKRDHIYHFTPHDSLYFNAYDTACYYTFKTSKGLDSLLIKKKVCTDNYKEWYVDIAPREGELEPIFYYVGDFIHNGSKEDFYLCYEKLYENTDPVLKMSYLDHLHRRGPERGYRLSQWSQGYRPHLCLRRPRCRLYGTATAGTGESRLLWTD